MDEKLKKQLKTIEEGLRNSALATANALNDIKQAITDYADFLEYLANQDEIDHSLNYAIKEGYMDDEGLDTPQAKLKAWKKLEADAIRGEMMAEDEICECEPDRMCDFCKKEEENSH